MKASFTPQHLSYTMVVLTMPNTVTPKNPFPASYPPPPSNTPPQAPSPSAPVTHNNPALRIKSEGATREEVRGIGNGENLDKIVTFVLVGG